MFSSLYSLAKFVQGGFFLRKSHPVVTLPSRQRENSDRLQFYVHILRDRRILFRIERAALSIAIAFLWLYTLARGWTKLNRDFPRVLPDGTIVPRRRQTTHAKEWFWVHAEKKHRSLDIPAIWMNPIT